MAKIRHLGIMVFVFLMLLSSLAVVTEAFGAATSMRFIYPSPSGSFVPAWIAKEAGYFASEGLDVEVVRVGGGTRVVAAMLGGSASITQPGAPAAMAAAARGADVVIIACINRVSPYHLMVRPEITQLTDLKGKNAGISAFGSASDFVVRLALKKYGLEPGKDVAILPMGGQPEGLAALQNGSIHLLGLTFPFSLSAAKLGMKELIKVSELGIEDVGGAVVTTRSFIARQRDTGLRFMRAFIRGMHRYGTDKEFSKRVLAKYSSIRDEQILEATWNEVAPTLLKVPRPSPKGMQLLFEGLFKDKTPLPKPESFVDNTLVDELERSGFIDSVYK